MKKIAVLGPEGTFCDSAYRKYKRSSGKDLSPEYCSSIDDIFECVSQGECEWGIAPIENTLDGYLQRTLDLLLEKELRIVSENIVFVQFSLVANVKDVSDIKKLYVQFKANGQCRGFINSLNDVQIISTESNMESYYRIGDEEGAAAIVPHHIAEEEKSDRLIIDNVTDAKKNHTRFVVVRKGCMREYISEEIEKFKSEHKKNAASTDSTSTEENVFTDSFIEKALNIDGDKIRVPVYIVPKDDRPGILFEILRCFYEKNINLISIMSRPTKQEMGTYNFYVEIEGKPEMAGMILETLEDISKQNGIKLLGLYPEGK
jgi:prephenate dehydratase